MNAGALLLVVVTVATTATTARAAGQSYALGLGQITCANALEADQDMVRTTEWAQGYVTGLDQGMMVSGKDPSGGRFAGLDGAAAQFHAAVGVMSDYCRQNPDKTVWNAAFDLWAVIYHSNHPTP